MAKKKNIEFISRDWLKFKVKRWYNYEKRNVRSYKKLRQKPTL